MVPENGKSSNSHESIKNEDEVIVADGGCMAWLVCMATMIVFGLYLGFEYNYGILYNNLIQVYNGTDNKVLYSGSWDKIV